LLGLTDVLQLAFDQLPGAVRDANAYCLESPVEGPAIRQGHQIPLAHPLLDDRHQKEGMAVRALMEDAGQCGGQAVGTKALRHIRHHPGF
jgi:hypothetical protein